MSVADSTMTRTKALPAAGASAASDSVDLEANHVGNLGDRLALHVSTPALPNLVEDKTVTFSLEDSADDSSWAALLGLSAATVTGATGGGAAAQEFIFFLPPSTRRYIRLVGSVQADGGNNTAASFTLEFKV